ncbi:MAG: ATP-binding protein [Nitrospinae bacterium]|nr:ATP-binding protein [Nitrospinota bacterium]
MADPTEEDKRQKELEVLRAAFQAFNETTEHLQKSYETLQERIKDLNLELEQKNIELGNNLQEKEKVKNYLHNILESLTSGVIVVDDNQSITTLSQTAGAILNLSPEECLNRPLNEAVPHPLFHTMVERLKESQKGNLIQDEELKNSEGRRIKIRVSASPVNDASGARLGTVLIVQDITELKQLEEEAERNDRLRAMGEMAAGIAHEIRNPLASIELFASVMKKDSKGDAEKIKLADHIISGVKNMDRIISSLLLFAKSPEPSRQQCNINDLLRGILESSTDLQAPDTVSIHCDYCQDEPLAQGDKELLQQVFLNFIRNAVQAMPDGGDLKLRIEKNKSADGNTYHRHSITTTISDTGVGIPSADRENIFNPFFSTKDKGTGLGLAIAHNIVKAHQGTIDVQSREGEGTTFIVNLPGWE